jgi:NAD(P)-dependent dehydrogenase (short-subunit alcohol dehydrogenase family)
MIDTRGKVAVITGAASGIGRGIAERCANEGMKVVLADIEEKPLLQFEAHLASIGCEAVAVVTDVSNESSVKNLAERSFAKFGHIHYLFNNAGVGVGGAAWEASMTQWNWAIDVNLKGVIYGLKYFIPRMLNQDEECYVVNTASLAGLTTGAGMAPYIVTKHAVVSLTETLFHDLAQKQSKIKTAVFCPVIVSTNIMDSLRNAPEALKKELTGAIPTDEQRQMEASMRQILAQGMTIEQSAGCLFEAMEQGKFYIITHPVCKSMIETRFRDILDDHMPTIPQ